MTTRKRWGGPPAAAAAAIEGAAAHDVVCGRRTGKGAIHREHVEQRWGCELTPIPCVCCWASTTQISSVFNDSPGPLQLSLS